jgi:hypothetical protein
MFYLALLDSFLYEEVRGAQLSIGFRQYDGEGRDKNDKLKELLSR